MDEYRNCLDALTGAVQQLTGKSDPEKLESIVELIMQAMTGPWRNFHTPEHIFEVGASGDAIEVISALFHDMVYVQVDQGLSLNISRYLTPFIKEVKGCELVICSEEEMPEDRLFDIVLAVFGMHKGQVLSPFAGQNEFLSAVIAAKCMAPILGDGPVAEIAACIEATIPFRSANKDGRTCSDVLHDRLVEANTRFGFGWSPEYIIDIVKRSVRLANRDVENFGAKNSADFLDNTWNLLPETNHELSNSNSYTVVGYRRSLQKMEGFMNFLKPEVVFHQYHNEPSDADYQDLIARTRKNLEVSKLYLGSKLFTIALLECLSYRLGKMIPLSTMMGELPTPEVKVASLADFLPDSPLNHKLANPLEAEVLEILSKGRNRESRYDIKNSPLTTLIIRKIGFSETIALLKRAKEFFNGNLSSEDFLNECPQDIVAIVTDALMKLFENRKSALKGEKLPAYQSSIRLA